MKFKFYTQLTESRFADYFADKVFKVSHHLNFNPKLVVLRLDDDGEFYAHFITGGKLKSTKSATYSETTIMDFSKYVEDKNAYKVVFMNSYFEFKDKFGTKYSADVEDDLIKDLKNVPFV